MQCLLIGQLISIILKDLPGHANYRNETLQEMSYSSDRNYFCQPYIGFVPESQEFKNVRKEMVRFSNKSAKRVGHKVSCCVTIIVMQKSSRSPNLKQILRGDIMIERINTTTTPPTHNSKLTI